VRGHTSTVLSIRSSTTLVLYCTTQSSLFFLLLMPVLPVQVCTRVTSSDEISRGLDSSATYDIQENSTEKEKNLHTYVPSGVPPFHAGLYAVYCFDEISTGLDSSATYDIVSALRTIARVRQTTALFSLLQPPPDVYNLFDRCESCYSTAR